MRKLTLILTLLLSTTVLAKQSTIKDIRVWVAPDNTRIVFDLSSPIKHSLLLLENPHRLVVDIDNTKTNITARRTLNKPTFPGKHLKKIRSGKHDKSNLRIVLDLKQNIVTKSFLLPPNNQYGHRLVVDLYDPNNQQATQKITQNNNKRPQDIIIAIDAGHGGDDPGASGPSGLQEKNITLQVSKKLFTLINKQYGLKAILTREKDYFLSLRNRIKIARQHKADLFISVHADSFKNPKVKGSSVYILSNKGASSEAAKWLAERENSSDLIGGVSLDDKDDTLASVLLDLSQTATLDASTKVANNVLNSLKSVGKVHKKHTQSAGFAVLKSPDVPSILIETTYISNPQEERKLNDSKFQKKLATAILQGIKSYFLLYPPDGTLLAKKAPLKHTIVKGDTLSGLAKQYRVNMHSLRQTNRLKNDTLHIGKILRIPTT